MAILSTRASRVARLVAVGAIAATVLSACIKVEADVSVNADATASGTFSLELQKEAANFLGITSVDTFAEGISSGEVTGGDNGLGVFQTCTPSESDTGYVYACTFDNATFTDDNGPWTITKEGDLLTFHMASQSPTEGQDATANPLGDTSLGTITVTVQFPGNITSTSGTGVEKTSDTTATISGSLTDSIDATITAESGGGFSLSSLLVILVFAGILILIIIVVIALVMRRRKGGSELDADTVAAAEAIPVGADAVALTGAEMAELEAPVEGDAAGADDSAVADETVVTEDTVVAEDAMGDTVVADETVVTEDADEEPPAPQA